MIETQDFQPVEFPSESELDRAIRRVADATHRLNEVIQRTVALGCSVELVRVSRHHDGAGNWGDQMVPMIRALPAAAAADRATA